MLLDAHLHLAALAQGEAGLRLAQRQQTGDRVMAGADLGIDAGVLVQLVGQAQAPGGAAQGLVKTGRAEQVHAVKVIQVAAHAGHQQPLRAQLPGVFEVEGVLADA